ncbi:50S ribosomal protein L11 methyltransferase [Candidatus Nucleicultrix amoebiphila]|jgi:ribosomal protein L11 methyltransferase|uniref:50S ribosomal protein L11 methyltransferase n=1 Tax=Candidatus Nucleicultrix amoebiphila TaxID=1509244 RepID=UPI000A270E29|nr:50S ribosomal protein L11 methyltransferase [Candidatus Nucleicultrix amoebiphila]
MSQSTPLWQLTFITHKQVIPLLAECFDSAAQSAFEIDAAQNLWRVTALFEESPDYEVLKNQINILHETLGLNFSSFELIKLDQKDWLAENRKSFPPIEIGDFYIYGSHFEGTLPSDKICFNIDAATAFGTGQHETTKGCLLALLKIKEKKFQNILDLGCGTGILAMAAAALFQTKVIATDNDKDAIAKTSENILKNNFKDKIEVFHSDGFSNPILIARSPFDLIIANILADPLIHLAPAIAQHTSPQSLVILSGLLETQKTDVEKAYIAQGYRLIDQLKMNEWSVLILQKQ